MLSLSLPAQSKTDLDAHYSNVIKKLRAANTQHLDPAQKQERARLIQVLVGYRKAGDYGINRRFPGERKPFFVDDDGRRCAVAYLLDRSGEAELTKLVQKRSNHAWVAELATNPTLKAWLDRSGLTMEEAGRIQGPSRSRNNVSQPPPPPMARDQWLRDMLPVGKDPDQPARRPSRPTPPTTGTPTAPATPPGRRPAPATPAGPTTPRGTPLAELPAQDWSIWWRFNRDEFLYPMARTTATPVNATQTSAVDLRTQRIHKLVVALQKQATHSHARIREAAAVAMGRLGDARAVSTLRKMLTDDNQKVRHAALLALGNTGSARAVHELLHVAKTGSAHGKTEKISFLARPFATIALGLAARNGSSVDVSSLVHGKAFDVDAAREGDMQMARLFYQVLAPKAEVQKFAKHLAEAKATKLDVRCRALETLPTAAADKKNLATLIKALNGSRLEARRSAALALGHFDHTLALGPLMTAFELEGELLTRAFLLLSIGRQGAPQGRDFLVAQMKTGKKTLKPWAAVGLGLHARKTKAFADKSIHAAIHKALTAEKSAESRGAYLVALGLTKDRGSVTMLIDKMVNAKNSLIRSAAAEALTLVGKDVAAPAIRKLLQNDQCYYARGIYAGILGVIGEAGDAKLLAKALREESHPETRNHIAVALGRLDGGAAFDQLMPMLQDEKLAATTRAQVIDGLGLSLAQDRTMALAKLYQRANFAVFPSWLQHLGIFKL